MTTPVLTKKEQKKSLSAKKGPVKGLRNILAQPKSDVWPVINVNRYPELTTCLNTILPTVQPTSNRIPLHMLKSIPKEDRVSVRKEMSKKTPPKPDIFKVMIMGINSVTRALEKNNICCVLLDANVKPPFMIKHIITMAMNKKIPVLLLPILKTFTLEKMGFATAAFALKQEVKQCPDNVCHPIYKSIAKAFEDFEVLECSLQHTKLDTMPDKSTMCEAKVTGTDCDTNPNISQPEKSSTVFTDVYRFRSSRHERAFIPPVDNKSSQVSETSDEFITLGISDFDLINNKNDTITRKRQRYVNIDKDKHTEKSGNTEKNQFVDKLKLDNADSMKRKRYKDDDSNYLSLKLKRTIGNAKRNKATKSKKKK